MDVDRPSSISGELKIKGQAEVERRKSKWDTMGDDDVRNLYLTTIFCFRWLTFFFRVVRRTMLTLHDERMS